MGVLLGMASLGVDAAAMRWPVGAADAVARRLSRRILSDPSVHQRIVGIRELDDHLDAMAATPEAREALHARFSHGEAMWTPAVDLIRPVVRAVVDASDWYRSACQGRDAPRVERMSLDAILAASSRWHRSLHVRRERLLEHDPDEGCAFVHEWPDGSYAVDLTTPIALAREGAAMDHCSGDYADRVARGDCRVLSVRDADRIPRATLEVVGHEHIPAEDGVGVYLRLGDGTFAEAPCVPWSDVVEQAVGPSNLPLARPWSDRVRDLCRIHRWTHPDEREENRWARRKAWRMGDTLHRSPRALLDHACERVGAIRDDDPVAAAVMLHEAMACARGSTEAARTIMAELTSTPALSATRGGVTPYRATPGAGA